MNVNVADTQLTLLAERALFWPARRALFVADVHIGKVETFQAHGAPLPTAQAEADIARLSALLARTGAKELWVLGDLVHGREALATRWLAELTGAHEHVTFHLVAGNHDRHVRAFPATWRLEVHCQPMTLGPFKLYHEPSANPLGYGLCGHLHPVVHVDGPADHLRLPCFHFGPRLGVLPAFTEFSGGLAVDRRAGRTYAIADGEVFAL